MKNNNRRLVNYLFFWFITIGFLFLVVYSATLLYVNGYFSFFLSLLILIYFLNIISGLILFNSNRGSHSKLSWFIVVIMVPILGPALFILFGLSFRGRMTLENYRKKYIETFSAQSNSNFSTEKETTKDFKLILKKISNFVQRPILSSNLEILGAGENVFSRMFSEMRSAKKFLHIEFYIFKKGEIFEEFKSILIELSQKGVEIRLIIDDFGRWALPWFLIKELEKSGIEISIWGKVHFPFISSENGFRLHRKFVNIDGKIVYTGGINIADEYAHLEKKFGYWFDLQMRIEGKATESYSILFLNDWKLMANKELNIKKYLPTINSNGKTWSVMVESGPDNTISQSLNTIIQLVLSAKKSIVLISPYFITNSSMKSVLKIAALSGVDVKIILPGKQDKRYIKYANKIFAYELSCFGVKFYRTTNMFIHTKLGIFDNEICYSGSVNLDVRSFFSQFEVMCVFSGEATKYAIKLVDDYWRFSKEMNSSLSIMNSKKNKLLSFFYRIFTPLM